MNSFPEAKDIPRDFLASNIGVKSNEKLFLTQETIERLGN